MRLLVTFGEKRTKRWPNVPTAKELGYGVVSQSPYGLVGPKGVDPAVVKRGGCLAGPMGGQIQLLFDAASGLINPGKAGQVRLIGVAAERRLPMLPDLPTFIEQGIAGFSGSTWAGLLAPARTPPAIIKRVSDEVSQIVRLDDVKSRLEGMGTIPAGSTPEEFAAFIDAETAKWGV